MLHTYFSSLSVTDKRILLGQTKTLPVWLSVLGSHQERCTQDRRPRKMVFAEVVRNQMVPSRAE